jgi:hypothetical protein
MTRINALLTVVLFSSLATLAVRADEIVFTKFVVKDCKEAGQCNWLVKFRLGYGDDWTSICSDPQNGSCYFGYTQFEVDTGETVFFAGPKSSTFDNYPLQVSILVEEYDSAFDNGPDFVGADIYTIHEIGSYWAWFENDEGHVEIYWEVVPETATSQAPLIEAPIAMPRNYMGILENGTDNHSFSAALAGSGLSYETFSDWFETYNAQGKRLVDVETFQTSEGRRYIGAYRESEGFCLWTPGVEWTTFSEYWKILTDGGLRLADFDTFMEGSKRLYSGAFVAGSGDHALVVGREWDSFVEAWQDHSAAGLRLFDLETYTMGNTRMFSGVFREAGGGYALWSSGWESFVDKWEDLTAAGLQLVDVETYTTGGVRQYVGVYGVASTGHVLVAGHDWEGFLNQYQSYVAAGFRALDHRHVGRGQRVRLLFDGVVEIPENDPVACTHRSGGFYPIEEPKERGFASDGLTREERCQADTVEPSIAWDVRSGDLTDRRKQVQMADGRCVDRACRHLSRPAEETWFPMTAFVDERLPSTQALIGPLVHSSIVRRQEDECALRTPRSLERVEDPADGSIDVFDVGVVGGLFLRRLVRSEPLRVLLDQLGGRGEASVRFVEPDDAEERLVGCDRVEPGHKLVGDDLAGVPLDDADGFAVAHEVLRIVVTGLRIVRRAE